MDSISLSCRERFHVPEGGPYALSHSVGCLPKSAYQALETGYLEPWRTSGGNAWPAWLDTIENFRLALARLVGGRAADYCPQSNLSSGLSKLLPALPQRTHRSVLLAHETAFPSLAYVLGRADRHGYRCRVIPGNEDPTDPDVWKRALTGDVAAALVTHVHSTTGLRVPVREISTLCHERSISCILDVAQSAGVIPFYVPDTGADVVLGSCVKWLCGGAGAGYMWVRPELVSMLEPVDVGWFSHAHPFEFDIHEFEYAPDARRFWGGTPSVAPYALATEGLKLIAELGVDTIYAHNRALAQLFLERVPGRWRETINLDRIGGTLCIELGDAFDRVTNGLRQMRAYFDTRDRAVRISFHAYNERRDAEQLAEAFSLAR